MIFYKKISAQNKRSCETLTYYEIICKYCFPNSKVQFTIPKGDKLLPVADLTCVFDNEHILFTCNVL